MEEVKEEYQRLLESFDFEAQQKKLNQIKEVVVGFNVLNGMCLYIMDTPCNYLKNYIDKE